MDCDRVRTQLTAYLEGELDGDDGTVVRGHLRTCETCRAIASDEATLRDGLRALPTLDPPSSLWEGVQTRLAEVEVEQAQRPAWRRALTRWRQWIGRVAPRHALIGGLAAATTIALVVWKTGTHATEQVASTGTTHSLIDTPSPEIHPDTAMRPPAQAVPDADDVTEDIARDTARSASAYDAAIEELLAEAKPIRHEWTDRERTVFDDRVADLRGAIANAAEGKPRDLASRALVDYLQGAVIRDEVVLAEASP